MLGSVKDVLTKDIDLVEIKKILKKEVDVKGFLPTKNTDNDDSKKVEGKTKAINSVTINNILKKYDVELTNSLRNDHKELLFVYKEVIKNTEAKKFKLVKVHLETLQTMLNQHFQKVDDSLYTYLDAFIRYKYPERQKAFNSLRDDMNKMTSTIFTSLEESVEVQLCDDTFYCFMCSFSRLGKHLNKCIDREVTLLLKMYEEGNCISIQPSKNIGMI